MAVDVSVPRGVRREQEKKTEMLEDLVKDILYYERCGMDAYEPELKAQRVKEFRARWYKECDNWNRLNKSFRLQYDAFDKSLAHYRELVRQQAITAAFNEWEKPFWRKLWYKIRYRSGWEVQLKFYFADHVYSSPQKS